MLKGFTILSLFTYKLCVASNLFIPSIFEFPLLHRHQSVRSARVIACLQSKVEDPLTGSQLSFSQKNACPYEFTATEANFGPISPLKFVGFFQPVDPRYGCEKIVKAPSLNASSLHPYIALISRGNCTFKTKVVNAERAGFGAAIIYGRQDDSSHVVMDSSVTSTPVSIPSFFMNFTSGTILSSLQANSSHPHLLTILPSTTPHAAAAGQNVQPDGSQGGVSDSGDYDSFGEHYFHICIYIWGCVVVSSLIALSVKWGCCGRSLTRWELRRIPLKRFQRAEGDEYQEKCPICHEEFHEGRLIRQLPCNHCYHSYCVDRWLMKMSNRCPLCKQRVSISLFCPWNKQRRKKEIHGHSTSDDAEASIDESPPIPPLATLTPSNWYGEAIMSGPSKFIIMRPGRPTRVIDIREQNKKARLSGANPEDPNNSSSSKCDGDKCHYQNFDEITCEQDTDILNNCNCISHSASGFSDHLASTQKVEMNCSDNSNNDDDENDDEIMPSDIPMRSPGSSRSCSVSSDQPLLLESLCGAEDSAIVKDIQSFPGSELLPCQISQSSVSSKEKPLAAEHSIYRNSSTSAAQKNEKQSIISDATVTLSSASSSVVSCNFKTPSFESHSRNPSTPVSSFTGLLTGISASSDKIPNTFLNENMERDIGSVSVRNKRHTLPSGVREVWDSNSTSANKDLLDREHQKPAVMTKHLDYS